MKYNHASYASIKANRVKYHRKKIAYHQAILKQIGAIETLRLTELGQAEKQSIVFTGYCLNMACQILKKITGHSEEFWLGTITEQTQETIAAQSEETVNKVIETLQTQLEKLNS